ncbi:DHH family phosphoesterase [Collinsella sp. zg1085]|uniref:DHH family phosphoesterase n=1 Tax=Collinsella sp. zg1085 TaxID=2844380 RepID=UPI001C0CD7D6|nr:DHH family phosphoesterase [Collinsella sp. zg1085]QWT16960.1 DHH family phosphoesterase [Collinsella sp. zg1085]
MSANSTCTQARMTTVQLWERAWSLIEAAELIVISGHTNPDGDALGAGLGLGLALRETFPLKRIVNLLADDASVPRIYRFMAGTADMIPASAFEETPDVFISVDVPTLERLHYAASVAKRARSIIAIDHHPCEHEFTEHVIRIPEAASTASLIEEMLAAYGITPSPEAATCLMTGLVTDTGRFQYQNANPAAFACAARLVDAGAEPARIALEVYQSQRLEYLQLESLVMGRIRTLAHGLIAYSYVYASDLEICGVSLDECDGLVDVVRSVGGTEVCLFLKETEPGNIRGNLRSKGSLDISPIARYLQGGGHAAAAGFSFAGSIDEALVHILPRLIALVDEAGLMDTEVSE